MKHFRNLDKTLPICRESRPENFAKIWLKIYLKVLSIYFFGVQNTFHSFPNGNIEIWLRFCP